MMYKYRLLVYSIYRKYSHWGASCIKARKVTGLICLGMAAIGVIVTMTGEGAPTESIPPSVMFFIIGMILVLKKGKSPQEKEKAEIEKSEIRVAQAQSAERFKKTLLGTHMAGLPLAEGSAASIHFEPEKISVSAGGQSFDLRAEKVTGVELKTDVEISKAYVSSIGGAVGGAVLFGPLGAIVGGRAKQKKSTQRTYYVIITYLKDAEPAYLSFEITDSMKAARIIGDFQKTMKVTNTRIEL